MKTPIILLTFLIAFTVILKAQNVNTTNSVNNVKKQFFIENKGQWPMEVLYLTRIKGVDAWITRSGITYDFFKIQKTNTSTDHKFLQNILPVQKKEETEQCSGQVVRLKLLNNQENCTSKGLKKQPFFYNYFIGNKPEKWAGDVNLYNEVNVEGVYDGVNMKYYYDNGSIRCDYILMPGTDPGKITILPEGADNYGVNTSGELVFSTRFGEVKQAQIFAYQETNNVKTQVNCSFVKKDDGKISFKAEGYNRTLPLIIDPLLYSTFIGGTGDDDGYKIVVDQNGNAYIMGSTKSTKYPTTTGAYDVSSNGNYDIFVTKLNPAGSSLVFSTYLGGSGMDDSYEVAGLAIDNTGYVYLAGCTWSSDFPTTSGAYQTYLNGVTDGFVTKLTPAGNFLVYSTYLGGTFGEGCNGLVVDNFGCACVAGSTSSFDFPFTHGAFDTTYSNHNDVFVTKLNSTGSALIFSTLLGGNGDTYVSGMSSDISGNIYLGGQTNATDFPTTSFAYNRTYKGTETYIAKFDPFCFNLIYSTFIEDYAVPKCFTIDKSGNAYIAGYAYKGYVVTPGAFDTSFGTFLNKGFITKLNIAGTSIVYSTLISAQIFGIKVDAVGNAYLVGCTGSNNYPVTPDALFPTHKGPSSENDGIITVLNNTGSALNYSTYFGGTATDILSDVALDDKGAIYATGRTLSSDYPTTHGTFDSTYNGNFDVVVTKLSLCTLFVITAINNGPICEGKKLDLNVSKNGLSYSWKGPNGFTSALKNPSINNAVQVNTGNYIITLKDSAGCVAYDTTLVIVYPLPTITMGSNSPVNTGGNLNLTVNNTPGATFSWTGPNGFTSSSQNPTRTNVALKDSGYYKILVTDTNGCSKIDSIKVVIKKGTIINSSAERQQIYIYPNPSNNELFIHLAQVEKDAIVEILDISGKSVLKQIFKNTDNIKLDISQIPSGTYNVRFLSNNTTLVERVLIER